MAEKNFVPVIKLSGYLRFATHEIDDPRLLCEQQMAWVYFIAQIKPLIARTGRT